MFVKQPNGPNKYGYDQLHRAAAMSVETDGECWVTTGATSRSVGKMRVHDGAIRYPGMSGYESFEGRREQVSCFTGYFKTENEAIKDCKDEREKTGIYSPESVKKAMNEWINKHRSRNSAI